MGADANKLGLDAVAAPRSFRLTWAEARTPLLRAAAAIWLPTLLPLAIGPLTECSHCVADYASLAPVLPGVLVARALDSQVGPLFFGIAALMTIAFVALTATLIGLAGRRWWFVAIPIAVLSGALSIGLGYGLRM